MPCSITIPEKSRCVPGTSATPVAYLVTQRWTAGNKNDRRRYGQNTDLGIRRPELRDVLSHVSLCDWFHWESRRSKIARFAGDRPLADRVGHRPGAAVAFRRAA